MSKYLDFGIGDEVRLEFVKNKVKILELRNEDHIAPWTNIKKIPQKLWQARYIAADDITFDFEFSVYNDVIALYGLDGSNIFCAEIHNSKSAALMKRMFDFIMKHAEPFSIINDRGEARVKDI